MHCLNVKWNNLFSPHWLPTVLSFFFQWTTPSLVLVSLLMTSPPPPPAEFYIKKSPTRTSYHQHTNNCNMFFFLFHKSGSDIFLFKKKNDANIRCFRKTVKLQNQDKYHTPSRLGRLNIANVKTYSTFYWWRDYILLFCNITFSAYIHCVHFIIFSQPVNATRRERSRNINILKYTNRTGDPNPVCFVLPF